MLMVPTNGPIYHVNSIFVEVLTYYRDMDSSQMAHAFKALGDPTRLRIVEFLRCCPQCGTLDEDGNAIDTSGATAGEVCCSLFGSTQSASKVSFHLKELRQAGLIHMERRGKYMVCSLVPETLQSLSTFLSAGSPDTCCP